VSRGRAVIILNRYMYVSGQPHAPAALLLPANRPGTQCTAGWVGCYRVGLDGYREEKSLLLPPAFEHRTMQHVASLYTDYVIPAPYLFSRNFNETALKEHQDIKASLNMHVINLWLLKVGLTQ
jgi:hypothetical protein